MKPQTAKPQNRKTTNHKPQTALFFLILCVILIFSTCKKNTFTFFESGKITLAKNEQVNENLRIMQDAILDLAGNETFRNYVKYYFDNMDSTDYLPISKLIALADQNNYDIRSRMKNSILNWSSNASDTASLKNILTKFTISDTIYEIMIYIPLVDSVDFSNMPYFSINEKSSTSLSGFYIYNGNKVNDSINELTAKNNPVWILDIIIEIDDNIEVPEMPWRRCYCSRGDEIRFADGSIGISSQGKCELGRSDHLSYNACGFCGRANISGICDGGSCPGC